MRILICIPLNRLDKIFKKGGKKVQEFKYIELGLSDPAHGCLPSFLTSRLAPGKKTRKGLFVHTLGFFSLTAAGCCRKQNWLFRITEQTFGLSQASSTGCETTVSLLLLFSYFHHGIILQHECCLNRRCYINKFLHVLLICESEHRILELWVIICELFPYQG